MTMPTQLVLRVLLADPTRERYGLEICADSGLPSGTIHPILARLDQYGWLESWWEEIDPRAEGRPRRRYYRLTPDGAERARIALASARSPLPKMALPPMLRPRHTGGQG
ncbi:PadR family transcriptional regulator [Nonomuraea sp. MG754425]|uniref:PadR family transcriptional regulator n=1 Tax=Nonomuraea sp. MG754425 TaxID=2570319 RepID=UPI001F3FE1A2|nr:helix-turn-helix transcriptional regulator [Nonomuraea sp. MG754425]MCF6475595.1 PadR family transcriptional regulator [Nonomuraea sp. MG754425]